MQDPYLPEGWTQEKIEEALEMQWKRREFCCHEGCGWVIGQCKHRTFEGKRLDKNKT